MIPLKYAFVVSAFLTAQRSGEPFHPRIDQLVQAGHPNYLREAAQQSSDAEFLRRIFLDLNGTIPTAAEAREFLADKSPDKRTKLIDKLLANFDYSRRMAQVFDVMLMERRRDSKVSRADWEQYLRNSFAANKPYDQLVRELLSADGVDPKNRAPAKFYLDRDFEPNLVTRDIGRLFLGTNLQCAQCHDHPIVEDYKQAHYYGIFAFLNRSFLFPNANAATAVIAEKAEGDVTFVSVFDKSKMTKGTGPMLPGGKAVAEPKSEKGKEYKVAPAKDVRPIPAFSRREQLAKLIATLENPAFARNAVNRIWATLIGRGIVHPLDLDHTGNPPSHPELLDLLAAEFTARKFDVKWLVREIVLSKTYQRSSELPAGAKELPPDRFLVADLRPLSPEQFGYAVQQATGRTDADRVSLGKNLTPEKLDAAVAPRVSAFRNMFAAQPGQPEDGFTVTLDQTLFVKFGGTIRPLLTGNLADRLAKVPDANAVAEELFLNVLTRFPTPEEKQDITAALAGSANRQTTISELVWALIACAEFRFNH